LTTHDDVTEVFKEIDKPAIREKGKSCAKTEARTSGAGSEDEFSTYTSVSKYRLTNPEKRSETRNDSNRIEVENELYSL